MNTTTRPPKTSTAVISLLALCVVALFVREVSNVLLPAAVGIVGALSLTASLRIIESSTDPAHRLAASLLSVPIATGVVVGVFGSALLLTGSFFPVENTADVSVASLIVAGNLGIVVGAGLAVFGVSLGGKNVVAPGSLTEYTRTAAATALIPFSVGLFLVASTALSQRTSAGSTPLFEQLIGQGWTALVAPEPPQLHLASFLITVAVTSSVLWLLVRRSPFETMLVNWRTDEKSYRRARKVLEMPRVLLAVAIILLPVAMLAEIVLSPTELRTAISPVLYGLLQTVTTAGWLRLLLLGTTVVAGGWIIVAVLLQKLSYRDGSSVEWRLPPLVVGVVITFIATVIADPVFEWLVDETARQLPTDPAMQLREMSAVFGSLYGETPIVVFLTGLLLCIPAVIGLCLRLAVYLGYLAREGTGFSIACGGLVLAAISASIISAPSWLILGGVATALAVWDIGHFGTALGREVATGASGQLVAVRTVATVLIGVGGVALAVALQRWLSVDGFGVSSTSTLALLSLVTALLAFSVALR